MEVVEQVLRLSRRGRSVRSFSQALGIRTGGYSKLLQRALTDFGAEEAFGRAALRVKEHYGIEVPTSAIRRITFRHGRAINEISNQTKCAPAKELVTEMDGSLIPVVQRGKGADGRKGKVLVWREARLCCARAVGRAEPIYGATLGSVENASWLWRQTAQRAGLADQTYVHGVGDGAPWIVDRFKENFGGQGDYLLDFFHVSEYLAAAGLAVVGERKAHSWLHRQQGRLLNNQWPKILRSMEKHREPVGVEQAPVRAAHRYLQERTQHLDFKNARQRKLPIGSGEIESGHRHVVQKRLKLAGSWWKETNAQTMLNLRTARANQDWNGYWNPN
jgi:hypothetical protein